MFVELYVRILLHIYTNHGKALLMKAKMDKKEYECNSKTHFIINSHFGN